MMIDRLKRQGLETMLVDLAVNLLSDLGSIAPALKDLGGRHAKYKVEKRLYGVGNKIYGKAYHLTLHL